jgi:hypothetical protein
MLAGEVHIVEVAYEVYIEMSTRKIGVHFDTQYDIITEVFDSWYEFFKVVRTALKKIPVESLGSELSKKVINLLLSILNDILRPCLTRWQGRLRKFLKDNEEFHIDCSPQFCQMQFDDFNELEADLIRTSEQLIEKKNVLKELLSC